MSGPLPDIEHAADDALVAEVQAGNSRAFEPLLDRHLVHIRAFIALRAPVSHLTDELAHETFVYAYRHLQDYKAGTSFRSWLRAIAWNLLRAEVQRFSREQAHQAHFAAEWLNQLEANPAAAQPSSAVEFLEDCLQELPAPMRELLALKYAEERSTDEIARRLRRTLAWVRTVLFRLRQQLKDCIKKKQGKAQPC
jgi:RNA polymerase sigma-70 factor (ECF subfamily)